MPLLNVYIQARTRLSNQLPYSQSDCSMQNQLSKLRYPYYVIFQVIN